MTDNNVIQFPSRSKPRPVEDKPSGTCMNWKEVMSHNRGCRESVSHKGDIIEEIDREFEK